MSEDQETPTVEQALERLAGRRALRIELDAHVVVLKETKGQNRKTRRNNLRIALAKARKEKP